MAYIDHIERCNRFDPDRFVPLSSHRNKRFGWIASENLKHLVPYSDFFDIFENKVILAPFSKREATEAMDVVCRDLYNRGILQTWRNEPYKVAQRFNDDPLFIIDRGAVAFFGIRSFGVHLNGYVKTKDGLKMWVAKRANDRLVSPGKYDNMVAGGQPANLSLQENLIKEGFEEAGIAQVLMEQARPVGMISYCMQSRVGLKPDVMFCYDLEVPEDFIPQNQDGEAQSFHLMNMEEVSEIVRKTDDFKLNCNLVVLDFLIRHGVLNPDETDEYAEICAGLTRL